MIIVQNVSLLIFNRMYQWRYREKKLLDRISAVEELLISFPLIYHNNSDNNENKTVHSRPHHNIVCFHF